VSSEEDRNVFDAGRQLPGEIGRQFIVFIAKRFLRVVAGVNRIRLPHKNHVAQRGHAGGAGDFEGDALRAGFAAVVVQNGCFQYVLTYESGEMALKRDNSVFYLFIVFQSCL
jgi:hypothetical protein